MGARRAVCALLAAAAVATACLQMHGIARAQSNRSTIFDTHSAVRITGAGGVTFRRNDATEPAAFACVRFRNDDARAATSVVFHFAFYDANDNRVGESDLTRAGHFVTGAVIADRPTSGNRDLANCVQRPAQQTDLTTMVVFVKAVTFADGAVWSTTGPAIPDHLAAPAVPTPAAIVPLPSISPSP